MKKQKKMNLFQYGIFTVVAITLYITGLHTEIIGFAQRGLLATGLMNPNVEEITQIRNNTSETTTLSDFKQADFNLKLIDDDGAIKSLADFKGKVIFMNFWATWCPPCVAEMPSIAKLHKEMGDQVAFVMLSFDLDFEKAKAFNKRKKYDLPVYAPAADLPDIYNSSDLPTTYIIDASGNLVLTHKGMADYSDPEFRQFLNSLN